MCRIKFFPVLALAIVATLLMTSVVYAYAAYYGNWAEQPYWGNWWWWNGTYLDWDIDDCWTQSGAHWLHTSGLQYHFEQEAYNPGQGTDCDRLKVTNVNACTNPPCPGPWTLPITHYDILNGCGSDAIKELVELHLLEGAIVGDVWYRHRVTYEKQNPGSGGDGEVNYSFSNPWDDSWLGKVVYDQWFNKKYSDPPGLVN